LVCSMANPRSPPTGNAQLPNYPTGMKIRLMTQHGLGRLVTAETRTTIFGDRLAAGLVQKFRLMPNGCGPVTTTITIVCIADICPFLRFLFLFLLQPSKHLFLLHPSKHLFLLHLLQHRLLLPNPLLLLKHLLQFHRLMNPKPTSSATSTTCTLALFPSFTKPKSFKGEKLTRIRIT